MKRIRAQMHKMSTFLAALIVVFSSRVPTELTVRLSDIRRISANKVIRIAGWGPLSRPGRVRLRY